MQVKIIEEHGHDAALRGMAQVEHPEYLSRE